MEEDESFALQSVTGISEKMIHQSTKDKTQSINTLELHHNNSTTKHHNNKKRVVNFKQDFSDKSDTPHDRNINKHNTEKLYKKNILKNANKNTSLKDVVKKEEETKTDNDNVDITDTKDKIVIEKKESNTPNKISQINNYNYNINIFTPKVEVPLNQINNIENQTSIKCNKEEKEEINNSSYLGKINSEISYRNNDFIIDIKDNNILMKNSD